jgi:hypothetical protein
MEGTCILERGTSHLRMSLCIGGSNRQPGWLNLSAKDEVLTGGNIGMYLFDLHEFSFFVG